MVRIKGARYPGFGSMCGGLIIFRHPDLVTHAFSVCTPYVEPHKDYYSMEDLVKGPLPQFGYQLHLAGPEVEAALQSEEQIRQFLNGIYGGKGPNGELGLDPAKGVLIENLPKLGKGRLFSDKVSSAEGKGACL
jgi:soluble epoxide hydrolase/lipid-phosphate phosphatase